MKNYLLIISFLFLSVTKSNGQDLSTTALADKAIVIEKEGFLIRSKLKDLNSDYLDSKFDNSVIEFFKNQFAQKEKGFIWSESELPNHIFVTGSEQINIKRAEEILKDYETKKKKSLLKDFRKYNKGEKFYRNFPLSLSRPIYTDDKKFAIIGFSRGNNGGEIILYEFVNNKWKEIGPLKRWAY